MALSIDPSNSATLLVAGSSVGQVIPGKVIAKVPPDFPALDEP